MLSHLKCRVEIPVFLLFFAFALYDPVFTNLLIYRTCYATLGYNESDCALLGSKNVSEHTEELERIVQPQANIINMTKNIIDVLICSVMCFFLGPWSDKHGRRPVFLSCLSGFVLGYAIIAVVCSLEFVSPWFFLVSLVTVVTGGFPAYASVCLCYITDLTAEENRGTSMGYFEAAILLGLLLGTLLSSFIFAALGYTATFTICAVAMLLALLYTIFFMPESVRVVQCDNRFKDLFSTDHIRNMFRVVFRQRGRNLTAVLLLTVAMMVLFIFVTSDSGIFFLFVRNRFLWSLERYTIYQAASGAWWVVGTIFVVYVLHKKLEIPEVVLLLVGFLSVLDGTLMVGLSTNSVHIYAAGVVRVLGGGVSPMGKTLVSKIVTGEELGKVFAFMTPLETLAAMVVTPVYTLVYNSTIDSFPSAYNFVTAAILVFQILIVMTVIFLQRRKDDVSFTHLQEESTENGDPSCAHDNFCNNTSS